MLHALLWWILFPSLLFFAFQYPKYSEEDELSYLAKFKDQRKEIEQKGDIALPIMSFNIRFDTEEHNPDNHWTKRVHRVRETLDKWDPWVIGLQEPFAGQVLHLLSVIPEHYRAIGYEQDTGDMGHPSRHHDFQVAILYNKDKLTLVEQDYFWLSKTPRVKDSKDWNSMGARTLNIARFQLTSMSKNDNNDTKTNILVFNTHIDVKSEEARREQAKIVLSTIIEWEKKYPNSITFLLGDFNTCPGQVAHVILTSHLNDTWSYCKNRDDCVSNSICSSFHGWWGSILNTYGMRPIQSIVFTLHGMQFHLPVRIPVNFKILLTDAYNLLTKGWSFSIFEAFPKWPLTRLHVDWILFHSQESDSKTNQFQVEPKFIALADVRTKDFSSDHFPLISLFQVKKSS